jgi:hypothetical protein
MTISIDAEKQQIKCNSFIIKYSTKQAYNKYILIHLVKTSYVFSLALQNTKGRVIFYKTAIYLPHSSGDSRHG